MTSCLVLFLLLRSFLTPSCHVPEERGVSLEAGGFLGEFQAVSQRLLGFSTSFKLLGFHQKPTHPTADLDGVAFIVVVGQVSKLQGSGGLVCWSAVCRCQSLGEMFLSAIFPCVFCVFWWDSCVGSCLNQVFQLLFLYKPIPLVFFSFLPPRPPPRASPAQMEFQTSGRTCPTRQASSPQHNRPALYQPEEALLLAKPVLYMV